MGEMADWFIERQLNPRRRLKFQTPHKKPQCTLCGSTAVHWRLFDGDYKLADDERQHPGNRFVVHACPTSADGFEDVPDA